MIIGISGKARSGKNTVGDMIIYTLWYNKTKPESEYGIKHFLETANTRYRQQLSCGWFLESFAQILKNCITEISGSSIDLNDEKTKNSLVKWLKINGKHPTYRELLQLFGTGVRNTVCEDFWIQATLNRRFKEENLIITDVRFENEIESIKNLPEKTTILRVNRDGSGANSHISETALDNYTFDYVIDNNGTLEDLLFKVKHFLIEYGY